MRSCIVYIALQTLTLDMHRYAMNLAKEHFHSTKLVLTIGNTDTFPDYSLACGDGVPRQH
jgi:hypothetical protein